MRNAQPAAVATALAAIAIGFVLAGPSGAISEGPPRDVAAAATATVESAVKALDCDAADVRSVENPHFGSAGLDGVTTYASSSFESLDGYLRQIGSPANSADFKAARASVDRIIFTTIDGGSAAVVVDRLTPTLWDWRFGAQCV